MKELEHARQRLVIQRQPVALDLEEKDVEIAPLWALVTARGALAPSKEERDPLCRMKLRNLPTSEGRMSLDLIVILKKRQ